MNHVLIDPEKHPHVQYRIDSFRVPAAARAEFEQAMRRNLQFIETQPGFLGHVVFEKSGGPTRFDVVTIAAWESADAIAKAGVEVRAHYERIGFDVRAALARWGAEGEIGEYRAVG